VFQNVSSLLNASVALTLNSSKIIPSVNFSTRYGNSLDKLCHTRSVAYSVELVQLNKHQILGGRAHLDCYQVVMS